MSLGYIPVIISIILCEFIIQDIGMHFYQYNEKTFEIEEKEGTGLIPNISYKIYF